MTEQELAEHRRTVHDPRNLEHEPCCVECCDCADASDCCDCSDGENDDD